MGNTLGIRQDRKTSDTRLLSIAHSPDPATRRRAQYALNARQSAQRHRAPKDHAQRLYGAKPHG